MAERWLANNSMIIEVGSSSNGKNTSIMAPKLSSEVQNLNKRLDVLEQEAESMREELVVCIDEMRVTIEAETKKLLSLCQKIKHEKIGLLQALCEVSDPSLVFRGPARGNAIACIEEILS